MCAGCVRGGGSPITHMAKCFWPPLALAIPQHSCLPARPHLHHAGGTGHPSTMHASSALNFPFDKWVAQEALMQQLRDAAGLKALRRLADALLFSYGGEKAGQLKMAAVLAALGWAGRPLTVDGWKAYKQQQEQAQQQVQGAQRGELPALHRGQPKSCQSVGVILKSGASKERPYEAFLSLRVLPSGQVGIACGALMCDARTDSVLGRCAKYRRTTCQPPTSQLPPCRSGTTASGGTARSCLWRPRWVLGAAAGCVVSGWCQLLRCLAGSCAVLAAVAAAALGATSAPHPYRGVQDEAAVLRDVAVMWRERQYGAKGSLAKQDWNFAPAG